MFNNIYLVRHGESTANAVNRFAGTVDVPLSKLGIAQARGTKHSIEPDVIFSSTMLRAKRTANILFPDTQAEWRYDERLAERDFGNFTLRNKTHLQEELSICTYEHALYEESGIMQGEGLQDMIARVQVMIDLALAEAGSGKVVVIVAHKYIIEVMARMLLGQDPTKGFDLRLPNCTPIQASKLNDYVGSESQVWNIATSWIVLKHSWVVCVAAMFGIATSSDTFPTWLPIAFIMVSAGMALSGTAARGWVQCIRMKEIWYRYIGLPILIGILGITYPIFTLLALALAVPPATIAVVMSRSTGGMATPAAHILIAASCMSAVQIPLLLLAGMGVSVRATLTVIAVSTCMVLVPIVVSRIARSRLPTATATFIERNGYLSVLSLATAAYMLTRPLDMMSFWPTGAWAILTVIGIRLIALLLTTGEKRIDKYVSFGYINVMQLAVLVAVVLPDYAVFVAWMILPMFALAPIDSWLARKYLEADKEEIKQYLIDDRP